MNNKVLVTLKVPDLETEYNIFLPINKKIGNIIYLLNKAIRELNNDQNIFINNNNTLYNMEKGTIYNLDSFLYETDIRNGSTLILM